MSSEPQRNLRPTLTLLAATTIVIGSVIGSGVFKKAAVMTDTLPSPVLVLGVWVLAAVVTFMGGLSAAELGAAFPDTGGLYAHLRRILGPFSGFLYGWAVVVVIQTGSIASIAYIFSQYLGYFGHWGRLPAGAEAWGCNLFGVIDLYPLREFGTKLVAVACIGAVTALNVLGVRFGAAVQNIFTSAKLLVILAILVIAAVGAGSLGHITGPAVVPPSLHGVGLLGAVALAMSGAFWAYDGWINVTYVASELRSPQRDLSRAMALGLIVVTAAYLAVNVAYYYLLPMEAVRGSKLVAADALAVVIPFGAAFASLGVVISTFGTVNGTTLASARIPFAMARDGFLPRGLGEVHPRFNTPHAALIVQGTWSALLVFSGTFDQLTDMLIFVSWAFYGLLAVAVMVARSRFPDAPRPYRVPGYPFVPVLFVAFSIAYLVFSVAENTRNALFGGVLVVVGIPIYFIAPRRPGSARSAGL